MNLLAHIYLSGSDDRVRIGNFIGDYVKGREYRRYDPLVSKGILLHRCIDSFTDHHPVPKKVKSLLRPYYRKYAGIVVDLFYDHYLTNYWGIYSNTSLPSFIEEFYRLLEKKYPLLPAAVQDFVPRMIQNNRLYSYITLEGVEHALQMMARYTSLPEKTPKAMQVLSDHYELIGYNFRKFFPRIMEHVTENHQVDVEYYQLWGYS
jgi:acyl carrier protein phosphodiesterase